MTDQNKDRPLAVTEDYVEPELLSPGHSGPRPEEPGFAGLPPERPGLLTRLKLLLAGGLALLAVGLFLAGAILTSTIIGAIIGIPLMIAGAVVFFLLFKLLSFGSKNAFVFRRF
jgi:hypothetical protein